MVQPRYGEARSRYGVLVFVTEDIDRHTLIKVESPRAPESRLYTLKLNNVLKFTTGMYDYSVMTFVFSAVGGRLDLPSSACRPPAGKLQGAQPVCMELLHEDAVACDGRCSHRAASGSAGILSAR